MTIGQVGAARPGAYWRELDISELKRASALAPATRRAFSDRLFVRRPGKCQTTVEFAHGRVRAAFPDEPSPLPQGLTVDELLAGLPRGSDARLVPTYGLRKDYRLPRDAKKVADFTGTLSV